MRGSPRRACQTRRRRNRHAPKQKEEQPISDDQSSGRTPPADADALERERAAREAAERQLLALMAEKRLLEHKVINARRTLAYGLGRALIEARSVKGLLALPGRIRRLRIKQKAKRRERVPNSFAGDVATRLQLVDPAFEKARDEGAGSAVDWVEGQEAPSAAKARALVELAHWVLDSDPDMAARIGRDAAHLDPEDPRLFALAYELHQAGLVRTPAALCAALRDRQPLSAPQLGFCDRLRDDAILLDGRQWEAGPVAESAEGADTKRLAIVCTRRWKDLPPITEARDCASAEGFAVSILELSAIGDLAGYSAVHIFADSVHRACSIVRTARRAGCQIVADLAHPAPAMLDMPTSELATVEARRLAGLASAADSVIARSATMIAQLTSLDIDHDAVAAAIPETGQVIEGGSVNAKLAEYGARDDGTTIGLIATLDQDAGLEKTVETFASMAAAQDDIQLLVVGRGDGAAALARKAADLGIAESVHFIGQPPPQRWLTLLSGLDVAVFSRSSPESIGSEAPSLMLEALALGRPVLASQAAWDGQLAWQPDQQSILSADADWSAAILAILSDSARCVSRTEHSRHSLAEVYRSLFNSL